MLFCNEQRSWHVKVTLCAAMAASRQMRVLYVFALKDLYCKRMDTSVLVWMDGLYTDSVCAWNYF